MAHASVMPKLESAQPSPAFVPARAANAFPDFPFQSLVVAELESTAARSSATFTVSLVLHALLIVAVVILPLLWYDFVPSANSRTLRAFFAEIPDIAPPPPPPPPAPAAVARSVAPVAEPARPLEPAAFVAPIEVPDRIVEEKQAFGFDEGVPGGVEGGVPGGVVGGVVGGLPQEVMSPSTVAPVVRIGGALAAPKLIHSVPPRYPDIAQMARLSGIVILEAVVDAKGQVESVKILRGIPLLDDAALEAVRQWRYKPLLLNGVPTRFILTVTVQFTIKDAAR